jgi:hypothetical protein
LWDLDGSEREFVVDFGVFGVHVVYLLKVHLDVHVLNFLYSFMYMDVYKIAARVAAYDPSKLGDPSYRLDYADFLMLIKSDPSAAHVYWDTICDAVGDDSPYGLIYHNIFDKLQSDMIVIDESIKVGRGGKGVLLYPIYVLDYLVIVNDHVHLVGIKTDNNGFVSDLKEANAEYDSKLVELKKTRKRITKEDVLRKFGYLYTTVTCNGVAYKVDHTKVKTKISGSGDNISSLCDAINNF